MNDNEKLDKILETITQIKNRFDNMDDKLKFLENSEAHISNKVEDLRLDVVVAERDIRRDLYELKSGMELVIEVLKKNKLLPDVPTIGF